MIKEQRTKYSLDEENGELHDGGNLYPLFLLLKIEKVFYQKQVRWYFNSFQEMQNDTGSVARWTLGWLGSDIYRRSARFNRSSGLTRDLLSDEKSLLPTTVANFDEVPPYESSAVAAVHA